jgi:hypothetical protein
MHASNEIEGSSPSNHAYDCVLIDCVDVADGRQTLYNVSNLSDLFTNIGDYTMMKF